VVIQPAQAPAAATQPQPQSQSQSQPPSSAVDIYNTIFAAGDEDASEDEPENDTITNNDSAPPPPPPPAPPEKIDLSTFKPTFVRRSDKDQDGTSSSASRKREKKDKKHHKKKGGGKVLVSFEVDVESGAGDPHAMERPKKKKRKLDHERAQGVGATVVMPPPAPLEPATETFKSTPQTPLPPIVESPPLSIVGSALPKGRKRAIDFM
jgi:G patch domain-containing protein 1